MSNKLWQSMKTHFIPNLVFTWNLNSGVLWHQDLARHNSQFSNCNPILGRSGNGAFHHQLHCRLHSSTSILECSSNIFPAPHEPELEHSPQPHNAPQLLNAPLAQRTLWDMVGPPVWQTGHSRRQVLWMSWWRGGSWGPWGWKHLRNHQLEGYSF